MKIKRLDIMGFKSFPERVQLPFSKGISAVVGPNGCGKSNIVDAIRWVMGEQSPKQLRGRNMEDILFNGAKTYQPSGLAEVTIVLANEDGAGLAPAIGPSEISITRRLFRSGDSEYLINKVPCRLKDITQFFMDTGMGTKAYAIIEQGRIGAMVDSRAEERRALIDEAAGITRYKVQKKEAERKIESTETNLTHISALMSETKRQINSLTRAAGKAVRYKEFKTELRDIELTLGVRELSRLNAGYQAKSQEKGRLEAEMAGLLTGLERQEVDLERSRLEIVDLEKQTEAKAKHLYELQSERNQLRQEDEFLARRSDEIQNRQQRLESELERLQIQWTEKNDELGRLDSDMDEYREEAELKKEVLAQAREESAEIKRMYQGAADRRAEATSRLAEVRTRAGRLEEILANHDRTAERQEARQEKYRLEIDRLEEELSGLSSEKSRLADEQDSLSIRIEEARGRISRLEEERTVLQAERDRLMNERRRIDEELAGQASRLATLQDLRDNFGWYPEGVKALMSSEELRNAGVLGPLAEKIRIPDGYEAAVEAALGERLKFVLVRDRKAAAKAIEFLQQGNLGRCGFLSLADIGAGEDDDLTRILLGDFSTALSLDEALASPMGKSALTTQGEYVGTGGWIIGGSPRTQDHAGDTGLLAQLKDIESLKDRVESLEMESDRLADAAGEAAARLDILTAEVQRSREDRRVAESALVDVEKRLSRLNGQMGGLESRLTAVKTEMSGQSAETERLLAERESAEAEKSALDDEEFDLTVEQERLTDEVRELADQVEDARAREQEISLQTGSLVERLKTAEREVQRTTEWLSDIKNQMAAKDVDLKDTASETIKISERRYAIAEIVAQNEEKLVQAQTEVDRSKHLTDDARTALNVLENEARQSRKRRSEVDEAARKIELDLQEIGFRRQAAIDHINKEYQEDLTELSRDQSSSIEADFDEAQAKEKRDDLRDKINSMGEVNLTAISEHEALMERYNFYKAQVEDLNLAIDNLKNSISRINRTCRIRFKSTFEAVDGKLREIFPLLFEGGEAWLSLTDESDPLDSGVEIHVHPPGKKLTVMSLLSGGEKALVALALIFALYLIKPSPFCLLDETDAPLDEANIDRFNRLLKKLGQSSQIIMVTHNKRTMQISHRLYGVTMEEPGISKMVSVSLSELEDLEENAQMVQTG